jgi:hypothetical protein
MSIKGEYLYIAKQFDTIYHILFFIVSFFAMVFPFLYCFLLLDIIKRNQDLVNILKSITDNKLSLTYNIILIIIAVYIFATIGFVQYQKFFGGMEGAASVCIVEGDKGCVNAE